MDIFDSMAEGVTNSMVRVPKVADYWMAISSFESFGRPTGRYPVHDAALPGLRCATKETTCK